MKRAIRMLTLIILILFFIYWRFFVSMDYLPKGELIFVSEAVNGTYIFVMAEQLRLMQSVANLLPRTI